MKAPCSWPCSINLLFQTTFSVELSQHMESSEKKWGSVAEEKYGLFWLSLLFNLFLDAYKEISYFFKYSSEILKIYWWLHSPLVPLVHFNKDAFSASSLRFSPFLLPTCVQARPLSALRFHQINYGGLSSRPSRHVSVWVSSFSKCCQTRFFFLWGWDLVLCCCFWSW